MVQMEGSFRRFQVAGASEVPTVWDSGHPQIAESLALLAESDKNWAQGDKIGFFPMESGNIRLVKLPFTDRAAIEKTLPSEVESSVPYDMEEMVLATRVLDVQASSSRCLALLARHDAVKARIEALTVGKVEPRMLAFDVDALASYTDRGVQVVVDVGHRRTLLAFCQGGQLLAGRVLASGGAALTAALVDMGLDWAQAEAFKHQASVQALTEVEAEWVDELTTTPRAADGSDIHQETLEGAVRAWTRELRSALMALEDVLELGIDELLLAGGGAQLGGLGTWLGSVFGVPVRPVLVPGGHPPTFALAAGLARAGAGELRLADLRIGDLAHHGQAERLWTLVSYGAGAVAVFMIAGGLLFGLQLRDSYKRIDELDGQIKQVVLTSFPDVAETSVSTPSSALQIMQERTGEVAKRVEVLGSILGGEPPTLETLKQISMGVPPATEARIDVKELTIGEESIVFKAETDSYETAAKIEESLQKFPRFSQAHRGDEKKVGDTLQFTMTIPLGAAETPQESPAPAGGEG